jgi:hypothetical protein
VRLLRLGDFHLKCVALIHKLHDIVTAFLDSTSRMTGERADEWHNPYVSMRRPRWRVRQGRVSPINGFKICSGVSTFMKTILRFAVAGALMAGYATAQAQALPSTGSSDLWLFVSDQAANTTFAEDTGISISSLLPAPYNATAGTLNTSKTAGISLAASTALSNYISAANSAGHALEWAVLGDQYPSIGPQDPSNRVPGAAIAVFDTPASLATANSKAAALTNGNVSTIGGGLEGDLQTILSTYTAGGSVYALHDPNLSIWGETTGNNAGSTNLYGQGADQAGLALGGVANLYGLTGNNNAGKEQSYLLSTNLTLSSTGNLSSVPLPAAVWLFGSGLLGLIGVGRRKAAAV